MKFSELFAFLESKDYNGLRFMNMEEKSFKTTTFLKIKNLIHYRRHSNL